LRWWEKLREINIYDKNHALIEWHTTAIQTLQHIIYRLNSLHEFDYDIDNNDAAIPHEIIPQFKHVETGGRPQVLLPWDTITAYRKSNHS
jgi:hypothetical protein